MSRLHVFHKKVPDGLQPGGQIYNCMEWLKIVYYSLRKLFDTPYILSPAFKVKFSFQIPGMVFR